MNLCLPLPGKFAALTVHPHLLILAPHFAKLEPWRQEMVKGHEAVHAEQMRRDGWARFVVRYLFSGRWRARYEMEANRVNLAAGIASGFALEAVADAIVLKVRWKYFPSWWFGRAPTVDALRAMLLG